MKLADLQRFSSVRLCRCGAPTWSSRSPYCLTHRPGGRRRWANKSRVRRGYGQAHKAMRKRYAAEVASGQAVCGRCGNWIEPGEPWDLGHNDDRSGYTGPEHRSCNRRAGGRAGAAVTNGARREAGVLYTSREW
jgi:hypothetical protein